MTGDEIRAAYLGFFKGKGHKVMPDVKDALNRWMDALTAGFTQKEKEEAYSLVSRMSKNAREYLKNDVPSR